MKTDKLSIIKMSFMILLVILTIASVSAAEYEVKFDKNTYDLADTIKLTFIEPENVENTSLELTYQKIHPDINYDPTTIYLTGDENISIKREGTYTITTKLLNNNDTKINTTTSTNLVNNILTINTFDLSIEVDRTILPKNNDLKLIADANNAQGDVEYTWTFNDGTGTIKTGSSVTHNFPKTGTHSVLLESQDAQGNTNNATQTITVQDAKIIWIEVRSDATNELIENADVDFGITSAKTDNLGRALFYLPVRTYILEVNKNKFRQTRQYIDVTKDNTYVIYLSKDREEYDSPSIVADTLTKDTVTKDSTILKYEVYDENPVRCEVYLKRKDTSWKFINAVDVLGDTKVYTADFDNLKETRYDWKIDCEDSHGNQEDISSYFYVDFDSVTYQDENDETANSPNDADSDDLDVNYKNETQSFLNQIEVAKENMESGDDIDKLIASLLEINTKLNIAEKDARSWEESLYRLTKENSLENYNTQLDKVRTAISNREDELIRSFNIVSDEIISSENDEQLFDQHYKNSGKTLSETDISTRVIFIQVELFTDKTEHYTLVIHEGFDDQDILTVDIPSSVASSRSEIKTKNSLSQVNGMTIEFTPKENEVVYFVEKSLELSDFENYDLVVSTSSSKNTAATGNSISFSSENFQSMILFALIGVLAVFYVVYNFELVDKFKETDLFNRYKGKSVVQDLKHEIKIAKKTATGSIDDAEKTYMNLMIKYQSLTRREKNEIYDDAMSLHNHIIENKIDRLQELIEACLYRDDAHSAQIHLNEMEQIYNNLPDNMKDKMKYKTILANFNVKNN